jgi:hypothetical protein
MRFVICTARTKALRPGINKVLPKPITKVWRRHQ